MARNNEDRFGADKMAAASDPSAAVSAEPTAKGLNFASPTEFVELPSRGRFYPLGHALHGSESIEIRFMTAKEEDILTSKTLLKKGLAIDRMLQSLIVDPQIKIHDLLVGDKNALIIASRISGYGSEYETKVNCPACSHVNDFSFNLEDHTTSDGVVDNPYVTGPSAAGTYEVVLPKLGVTVELRLSTGVEEKKLIQMQQMKKKNKLPESPLTDQLRTSIVSVDGDSERATVNKLVNNMPAFDSRFVRNIYSDLMPNVDMTGDFTCEMCEYNSEVEVPFTVDFFWPK
jgi:hypothetical protein